MFLALINGSEVEATGGEGKQQNVTFSKIEIHSFGLPIAGWFFDEKVGDEYAKK